MCVGSAVAMDFVGMMLCVFCADLLLLSSARRRAAAISPGCRRPSIAQCCLLRALTVFRAGERDVELADVVLDEVDLPVAHHPDDDVVVYVRA